MPREIPKPESLAQAKGIIADLCAQLDGTDFEARAEARAKELSSQLLSALRDRAQKAESDLRQAQAKIEKLEFQMTAQGIEGRLGEANLELANARRELKDSKTHVELLEGFCNVKGVSADKVPVAVNEPGHGGLPFAKSTDADFAERLKAEKDPRARKAIMKEFEEAVKAGTVVSAKKEGRRGKR